MWLLRVPAPEAVILDNSSTRRHPADVGLKGFRQPPGRKPSMEKLQEGEKYRPEITSASKI